MCSEHGLREAVLAQDSRQHITHVRLYVDELSELDLLAQ